MAMPKHTQTCNDVSLKCPDDLEASRVAAIARQKGGKVKYSVVDVSCSRDFRMVGMKLVH